MLAVKFEPRIFVMAYCLLMPLGLGLVATWAPLHAYMRTASAAIWSGWVQAIGSILAILAGFGAIWWQHSLDRRRALEERTADIRNIEAALLAARRLVEALAQQASTTTDLIAFRKTCPVWLESFGGHQAIIEHLLAHPLPNVLLVATLVKRRADLETATQKVHNFRTFGSLDSFRALKDGLRPVVEGFRSEK